MFDLAKEIWQTMRTNKLRTFLTGFSVAWGIFMLILLLAIAKGVNNNSRDFLDSMDNNRVTIWGGSTSKPYQGLKEGRKIELRTRDFEPLERSNSDMISSVTASTNLSGTVSTSKDYIDTGAKGVYPSRITADYKILKGRKLNDADINESRKTMLISKDHAKALFNDYESAVGKIVTFRGVAFTIVGVYDHRWENSIFIPYTTAYALSGYQDYIQSIDVHLDNVTTTDQSAAVEQGVREAMAKTERFDPTDDNAIYTNDSFANYVNAMMANNVLNYAMWVIGLLTLITGIVGVSNIMFVSVKERTHEIGIRRAIGAKPRSILTQVVLESIALTTCFGYIGIVMGTLAVEAVKIAFANAEFIKDPGIDLSIAFEVTAALIIAGALAGLFPAMRAIKVKPVEALMEE